MKDFLEWVKSIPELIIKRLSQEPTKYVVVNFYPKVQPYDDTFIIIYQECWYEFPELWQAVAVQDYAWERGFESYLWEINGNERRFVR